MRLTLREYERRAVRELADKLKRSRRVVAVGPTGCGKTVIASAVVERLGVPTLWLAHRRELLSQAAASLHKAGARGVELSSIDCARRDLPTGAALIVVDEAHRTLAAGYKRVLAANPEAMVLGLTATPWRLDGAGLGDVYAELYTIAESLELQASGFLARPIVYGVPRDSARELVRGVPSSGGDYAQGALGRSMARPRLMGDCVAETRRLIGDARTIVFAASREHGRALAREYARADFAAEYLDGKTADGERDAILQRFRKGYARVVVNVDVLSEGYDLDGVKGIVLARPTRSLTRYLQYVGRAMRPFGKARPVILDHAGNSWRFGLPDSPREWSLSDRDEDGKGDAPMRRCSECGAMYAAALDACPECGAAAPQTAEEVDAARVELEHIEATRKERARRVAVIAQLARANGWSKEQRAEVERLALEAVA